MYVYSLKKKKTLYYNKNVLTIRDYNTRLLVESFACKHHYHTSRLAPILTRQLLACKLAQSNRDLKRMDF